MTPLTEEKERRYGKSLTDEERQQRHYEEFGEWLEIDELPPRGSDLAAVGIPTPAGIMKPSSEPRLGAMIESLAVGAYTSIETIYGPAEVAAGSTVSLQIVARNLWSTGIYLAITSVFDSTQSTVTPEYAVVNAGASYAFKTNFTMPNKDIIVTIRSYYWAAPNWILDDQKAVAIKLPVWTLLATKTLTVKHGAAPQVGWVLLATKTASVKHGAAPQVGWVLLSTKTASVKHSAAPQVGWVLLATKNIGIVSSALPAKWELQEEYIDPWAYYYKGPVQELVAQVTAPPEQFPWTKDVGVKVVNKLKEELANNGSRLLEFRIYMDTAGPLWSRWRVEVVGTGSEATADTIGFPVYPILMAALILAIVIIISLTIIHVVDAIYKPKKLSEDVKKQWSRETLISMVLELRPGEYSEATLQGKSDQEIRDILNQIYSEEVGAGINWVPIAIIGGIAVAGTAIGVSAAKHFIPAKTKKAPAKTEKPEAGKKA
jgi:hypothetical protein